MEKENLRSLIIIVFKEWINKNNPTNYYQTNIGLLRAEDIYSNLEEETQWGLRFLSNIRAKCFLTGQGIDAQSFFVSPKDVQEKTVYFIISDLMNKFMSLPPEMVNK
jgi:hypothetical protein